MNLQSYKEKYPRLEDRLTKYEKKAKIAEIMLDLKKHEGMKMLLAELENIVNAINTKLMTRGTLETEEREKLMVDKERCEWLISIFPGQKAVLKHINDYLKKL